MTANQKTEKTLRYWHEVFKTIKGRNEVKVYLLLHLLHGSDYAYNIAKFYRESNIGLSPLGDPSQLQPILSEMEKEGFLSSKKSEASVRPRRYFSINPAILQSPTGNSPYHLPEGALSIQEKDLKELFAAMEKEKRIDPAQFGITKFDFVTFLLAVSEKAKYLGFTSLGQSMDAYLAEVDRLEREKRRINSLEYHMKANIVPPKKQSPFKE